MFICQTLWNTKYYGACLDPVAFTTHVLLANDKSFCILDRGLHHLVNGVGASLLGLVWIIFATAVISAFNNELVTMISL